MVVGIVKSECDFRRLIYYAIIGCRWMANSLIMGFDGNSGFTGFVPTSQAYFNINQLGNSGAISGSTGNENYCQAPFVAGTFSNLWCRVKTAASSFSTVVLRKNARKWK